MLSAVVRCLNCAAAAAGAGTPRDAGTTTEKVRHIWWERKKKREIHADRRHHLRSGGEDKSGGFLGERKGKEKKEERSA